MTPADTSPADTSPDALFRLALAARENACAPFSRFRVGAAVVGGSGRVYTGCNVENASYPLCCCAERVAVFKAVSEGESAISAVLVLTDTAPAAAPCGACRQVLYAFGPDATVWLANLSGVERQTTVRTLLPDGFSAEDLFRGQRAAP